jgi:hypothetical protein
MKQKTICNKCGLEELKRSIESQLLHKIKIFYTYPSKYDLTTKEFHLCEDCLDEIFESFKIKPKEDEYVF